MRTRVILAFIAVFLAGVVVGLAEDQFMGTWKLNEKQSTFPPGATKNHTVVYAPAVMGVLAVALRVLPRRVLRRLPF